MAQLWVYRLQKHDGLSLLPRQDRGWRAAMRVFRFMRVRWQPSLAVRSGVSWRSARRLARGAG